MDRRRHGLVSRPAQGRAQELVKNSALRWIRGDLHFNDSLPRPDYIQRLVEQFRESSSPESMRRMVFDPDKILCEYASASFHLPGAYDEFFPCPHCTHTDEQDDKYEEQFAEVFHLPNVHEPNVCATVTFTMPTDARILKEPTGCSIEVEFAKGCPNAPISGEHSLRAALHIHVDVFFEVLCFLTRSELEKMQLVSRRWSNVIGRAEGSLQQRRSFTLFHPDTKVLRRESRNAQRSLCHQSTPGAVADPSRADTSQTFPITQHDPLALRNTLVDVVPYFLDSVPPPGPPSDMLVDIPLPARIGWFKSLLRSKPLNSEFHSWGVVNTLAGFGNFPTLPRCALKPHWKHDRVQKLELGLCGNDATYRLQGVDTVVRVNEYANRAARECLTVVTFDHFHLTALFFKGNMTLPDLKLTLQRTYAYY